MEPKAQPKVDLIETFGPAFVLALVKDVEGSISLHVETNVAKSSLSKFFDVIENSPPVITLNPLVGRNKFYVAEAKLAKRRFWLMEDFTITDFPGVAEDLPPNSMCYLGVSYHGWFAQYMHSYLSKFKTKEVEARAKAYKGYIMSIPRELKALEDRFRNGNRPLLVKFGIVTTDKDELKILKAKVEHLVTPSIKWCVKKCKDFGTVLEKFVTRPRLSIGVILPDILGHGIRIPVSSENTIRNIELPNPKAHNVAFVRGRLIPLTSFREERHGFIVGYAQPGERPVALHPSDFYGHCYIIGATGSGKSSCIRMLVKALYTQDAGAIVVVDPHGELARDIYRWIDDVSRVVYLHPTKAPFGINPLDLPEAETRDQAVNLAVEIIIKLFTNVLRLDLSATYVLYLLRVIGRSLYKYTDHPTLGLLYRVIHEMFIGGKNPGISDPNFTNTWQLIQEEKIPPTTVLSALSRLEPFYNSSLLRKITSKTTIPLDKWIRNKYLILFDLSKSDIGEDVASLLACAIVLKLWFYVNQRARFGRTEPPIFLFVDEGQVLQALPTLETILTEARKFGLHIIFAHQHTKQISQELLQSLLVNTGVKFIFRVVGNDADVLAQVDPSLSEDVKDVISTLPKGHVILTLPTPPGESPPPPIHVRLIYEEPLFKRDLARPKDVEEPEDVEIDLSAICPILRFIDPPQVIEQRVVYVILKHGGEILSSDIKSSLPLGQNAIERAITNLNSAGYITIHRRSQKARIIKLEEDFFKQFYSASLGDVGKEMIRDIVTHYILNGYYVAPVKQNITADRPDLIAIPVDNNFMLRFEDAIAIEIEALTPDRNIDHVYHNMAKYKDMGNIFKKVHVWVKEEHYDKVSRLALQFDYVDVFNYEKTFGKKEIPEEKKELLEDIEEVLSEHESEKTVTVVETPQTQDTTHEETQTQRVEKQPAKTEVQPKNVITLPNGQKFEVLHDNVDVSKIVRFLRTGSWKLIKKENGMAELVIRHQRLKTPMKIRGRLLDSSEM